MAGGGNGSSGGPGGDFGGGGDLGGSPGSDFGGGGDLATQGTSALQYGNWTPAFFMPARRSIGGIVAQVTIDEQASDDVQITEHPVEQGAPIADHAFKRPSVVTIRAGWTRQYAWDLSAESGVYGLLLSWQAALLPFDVATGKRHYTNMLIERLQVTTDNHTEFALMATITCRQVIIVSTSTTTAAQTASSSDGSQSNPSKTGGEKNSGDTGALQVGGGATLSTPVAGSPDLTQPPPPLQAPSYAPTDPASGLSAGGGLTPQSNAVNLEMNRNQVEPPNVPEVPAYSIPTPAAPPQTGAPF
jgi:hypothetical protein